MKPPHIFLAHPRAAAGTGDGLPCPHVPLGVTSSPSACPIASLEGGTLGPPGLGMLPPPA